MKLRKKCGAFPSIRIGEENRLKNASELAPGKEDDIHFICFPEKE